MSNNSGTLVIAPVRPQSPADTYPSALANELQGGYKTFQDTTERDALPEDRRMEGEMCYIIDDDAWFYLKGGVDNSFWTAFSTPGGLPAGGATGQMLVKSSDADFDAEWIDDLSLPYAIAL